MEIPKKISKEEIIDYYKKLYEEKKDLTAEEKEKFLYWIMLDKFQDDLKGIKPLVMGGYPKLLYNALTPYYQIIASIFIFVGIGLLIASIAGFYISALAQMVGYVLPSILSLVFGIIIILFLNTLESKTRK